MLKKYAMLCINRKYLENNTYSNRRVLVEYKDIVADKERNNCYQLLETRLVDTDNYFKDTNKSHTYKFEDNGYVLVNSNYEHLDKYLENEYRTYHYIDYICLPILIECETDEEAIKQFQERTETRD